MRAGPWFLLKEYIFKEIPLSSSTGTKSPTQKEDGNFRLSTGSLEHHPVTAPPINQKKTPHPEAFTPNFAYKNFPKQSMSLSLVFFEHDSPVLCLALQ